MRPDFNVVSNWGAFALLIAALFLPIYGPFMVDAEGAVFPVTSPITIIEANGSDAYVDVRFAYSKLRACEIVGVEAQFNGKHVGFERLPGDEPGTRRPGEQVSQIWRLQRPSLDGVSIYWIHRCHPLWLTVTKVYGD